MAGALFVGVAWMLTHGFEPVDLLKEALFFMGMGFFIGREVQFWTFRREFLGIAKGRYDSWYWATATAWMIWGVIGISADLWYGPRSGALARVVLWWLGVFLATVMAVRTQIRLERLLLSKPWKEDEPHWAAARTLAEGGCRYEGRLFRRVLSTVPARAAGTAGPAAPPRAEGTGSTPIEELRRRALSMLLGNESALDRLVAYERRRTPGASESELLYGVIDRIRRDQL